jgi:hypothetical protein
MKWYSEIYKAFIVGSVIAFVISMFTSGKVSYGGQLAGYASLSIGIMLVLIILFYQLAKNTLHLSSSALMYNVLMTTGPFMLMFAIIIFVLYLLIVYKDIIINDHVSKKYKIFSNITLIWLLIQVYLGTSNLNSESFKATGKISKLTSSLLYLFSVLTLGSSLILYVILKHYTTDG